MSTGNTQRPLSGERMVVTYLLAGSETEAVARAKDICIEQTVEFPEDLVPDGFIRDEIVGRIESLAAAGPGRWRAEISYAIESTGLELLQLLNVTFGNISMKPGVRVERLALPEALLKAFRGPRFGRAGLRRLLGITSRPLICTAIKPMGLSAAQLG
jgi:ribulose-bisphosphate carboxylase large chain